MQNVFFTCVRLCACRWIWRLLTRVLAIGARRMTAGTVQPVPNGPDSCVMGLAQGPIPAHGAGIMDRTRLLSKLPLLIVAIVAIAGAFFLRDRLTFAALSTNRDMLIAFRDAHYIGAVALFMLAYIAVVAFSLPGATLATLTGGFLFGLFPGVIYNVVAASIGAVSIYLAARSGLGAGLSARMAQGGGKVARLQAALQDNVWSALLFLRLAPVVPFFLANLIPAFVGVKLVPFAVTTFVGIMPGALVLTSIGSGLGDVLATGGMPDLSLLYSPQVLLPVLGLALLAALPMLLKLRKG
jgi:uncharacterized membrane protein YdjX (TVP38/TMEM64 family)